MKKILSPSVFLPSILLASILSTILACSVNANEQVKAKSYHGKTDAELARELANPNTPLTSLKFKTQYRTYTGDVLDAGSQSGTNILLQPTLPINFAVGKTLKLNGRPWKFSVEINYYVDQNDNFGPDWMIGINIAGVVENQIANWFR